jgi:hypothetical protein
VARARAVQNGHQGGGIFAGYGPLAQVYGVVSAQAGETLELFIDRDDADAFIAEVEGDDPSSPPCCQSRRSSSAGNHVAH